MTSETAENVVLCCARSWACLNLPRNSNREWLLYWWKHNSNIKGIELCKCLIRYQLFILYFYVIQDIKVPYTFKKSTMAEFNLIGSKGKKREQNDFNDWVSEIFIYLII